MSMENLLGPEGVKTLKAIITEQYMEVLNNIEKVITDEQANHADGEAITEETYVSLERVRMRVVALFKGEG